MIDSPLSRGQAVFERRAARGAAIFDPTGAYRYQLLRIWEDSLPRVCWVMLNPSTATATVDDPTISRVVGFSRRWGYGSAAVVNLFAIRTTDPRELRLAAEPVGPDNDRIILAAVSTSGGVIAAWGNQGTLANPATGTPRCDEAQGLLARAGVRSARLGTTKRGQPRHPLYLPASTRPSPTGPTRGWSCSGPSSPAVIRVSRPGAGWPTAGRPRPPWAEPPPKARTGP